MEKGEPLLDGQNHEDGSAALRRDKLLLRLLKTPPQPRPKRERGRAGKNETFEEFQREAMRRFPQPPIRPSETVREEAECSPRDALSLVR